MTKSYLIAEVSAVLTKEYQENENELNMAPTIEDSLHLLTQYSIDELIKIFGAYTDDHPESVNSLMKMNKGLLKTIKGQDKELEKVEERHNIALDAIEDTVQEREWLREEKNKFARENVELEEKIKQKDAANLSLVQRENKLQAKCSELEHKVYTLENKLHNTEVVLDGLSEKIKELEAELSQNIEDCIKPLPTFTTVIINGIEIQVERNE